VNYNAGHDNYYNQSYPFVFERRTAPIFKALGINLDVRNIAMGANQCFPSDYCYEAQGGSNADWLSWEQSYNCGKDKGIFELMARLAWWNKAVLYMIASGAIAPSECKPSPVGSRIPASCAFPRVLLFDAVCVGAGPRAVDLRAVGPPLCRHQVSLPPSCLRGRGLQDSDQCMV
jgi:hypothetical protein